MRNWAVLPLPFSISLSLCFSFQKLGCAKNTPDPSLSYFFPFIPFLSLSLSILVALYAKDISNLVEITNPFSLLFLSLDVSCNLVVKIQEKYIKNTNDSCPEFTKISRASQ